MGNGCCKRTDEKNSEIKMTNNTGNKDLEIKQLSRSPGQHGSYYHFTHNAQNPLQGRYVYDGPTASKIIPIGDTSSHINNTTVHQNQIRVRENGTVTKEANVSPASQQTQLKPAPSFAMESYLGATNSGPKQAVQSHQPTIQHQPYPTVASTQGQLAGAQNQGVTTTVYRQGYQPVTQHQGNSTTVTYTGGQLPPQKSFAGNPLMGTVLSRP